MERTRSITRLLPLAALLASTFVVAAVAPAGAVPSPDLVISEVYGAGGNSGAVLNADFVELFNRGDAARSLSGLSIQYASATGAGNFGGMSNQLVELPPVDVPPGGSFLVGMTPGTTGAALPTPDAIGTIAMAAGAGKVALVTGVTTLGCNGGSTPCATDQLARIIDLVGYGNANFFEGTAAPTISPTTSAQRAANGCTDTDVNSADFVAAAPAPQTSASPAQPCDGPPPNTPPVVTPNPYPIEHPAGTAASYPVIATDDIIVADVTIGGVLPLGISVETGSPGSSRTLTVTVGDAVPVGVYPILLTLTDDRGDSTELSIVVTVTFVDACGTGPTATIMEVQSTGAASPLVGQDVRVEGIVTESFQAAGQVGGFYLQDPVGDGDAATSDGILVFNNNVPVQAGQRVRLTGRVAEFQRAANAGAGTVTQLGTPFAAVTVCGTGSVPPTEIDLPFAGPAGGVPAQERYEGMLVTMPDARTVTEVFTLGRFGEVVLTSGDPLFSPTNGNVPGTPEEIDAANDANRILLDDAKSGSNVYPGAYVVGDDSHAVPRVGDTVAADDVVRGVFTFDFGVYRIQPVGEYVDFVTGLPRPTEPDPVGGDVSVASFNVLNYFTSIDDARWNGADDRPRGATSAAELDRQQTKIVQGILGLDADIVGLIEIENNGPSADPRVGPDAVQALVQAINDELPPGAAAYATIDDPDLTPPNFLGGTFGTDAIKVAIIYRPARVTPVGKPVSDPALLNPPDPAHPGEALFDRPPIAQVFARADGAGVPFTLIVNHFKSKGSLSPNCDQGGGGLQGNCNDLRVRQAQGVLDLIAGAGLERVAILGDLNAYSLEDPIATLEAAGFTSPLAALPANDRYSYVFEGERGELDHALVDGDVEPLVTGADIWHINSIEPPAKDYTSFNNIALFEPNAFRSSDHDPLLVGLDLTSLRVDDALIVQKRNGGGTLAMTADVDGTFTACPTLDLRVEGAAVFAGPTTRLGQSRTCISLTSKGLVTFDLQTGAVGAVLTLPSTFRLTDDTVTFALTVNGAAHVVDRPGRRLGLIWTTI